MTDQVKTSGAVIESIQKLIGDAWRAHRQGQHETALNIFRQVLSLENNNVDALYGLGLVLKNSGDTAHARETFSKLQDLLKELQSQEDAGAPGRYYMLNNMVRQQLRQLG